jgi:3-hydroxyisobutyrate dehydrogenase-like beta-hydroxyacid dehydrogenase
VTPTNIGFLHPGAMGISLAASAQDSGHTALWASEGRSADTRERAESRALTDAGTLGALCATCSVIVSICPPHAAEEIASNVLAHGFRGLYLDANAISPARTRRIAAQMDEAGAAFVDGGIIGGPAWKPDSTWLYLAGPRATDMALYFDRGPLETAILGESASDIGQAAALKMVFAAYTKGTTALLAAILGVAEANGVREALEAQWSRGNASFARQTQGRVRGVTAKAWRFEGEMHEIAATFEQAGLPGGFHQAAAEIYHRLAIFKEEDESPSLDAVLDALLGS